MKPQRLPPRIAEFATSELLHGDIDGFIINAYLALQRQWPDEGGFRHYHYLLTRTPGARAQVLRELAASQSAQRMGIKLRDDLPAEHVFDPYAHDLGAYQRQTLRLQILHLIHDARDLRDAISRITLEGISEAVQRIVETSMSALAQMDSRIAAAEAEVAALRQAVAGAASPAGLPVPEARDLNEPATRQDNELAWLRHEVLRLGRRVGELESAAPGAPASADTAAVAVPAPPALGRLEGELVDLRNVVMPLHERVTGGLRRELADYVHALLLAEGQVSAQIGQPVDRTPTDALKPDDAEGPHAR